MSLSGLGRRTLGLCAAVVVFAACGALRQPQDANVPPVGSLPVVPQAREAADGAIQHVIVVVQENRSVDNLFAGFPNADAPTYGFTSTGERVPLKVISLERRGRCADDSEKGGYFQIVYDRGKMDGWNLLDAHRPLCPYTRVERRETRRYWNLATRFAFADHFFSSTRFGEFVNGLYLIAGTTKIAPDTYDIGLTTGQPAGCDSPEGTRTSLLKKGRVLVDKGPFPCFTQFPTMANLLDEKNVGWRYYYDSAGNAFQAIKYVVDGPDWKRNMSSPAANVLGDLARGKLAAVSWVISPPADSDFPGNGGGPKWVDAIVRAAQKSRYWAHMAIVVTWNNAGSGRFYDDVPPPQLDPMGLGVRVPAIVISPLAKRHYVSHTQYEFGSILKFIEENWNLGSLGATDVRANSIGDMLGLNR